MGLDRLWYYLTCGCVSGGIQEAAEILLENLPSEQEPPTWGKLPAEIHANILGNLSPEDLLRVRATDRYLRNLVAGAAELRSSQDRALRTREVWRKIKPNLSPDLSGAFVTRETRCIQILTLKLSLLGKEPQAELLEACRRDPQALAGFRAGLDPILQSTLLQHISDLRNQNERAEALRESGPVGFQAEQVPALFDIIRKKIAAPDLRADVLAGVQVPPEHQWDLLELVGTLVTDEDARAKVLARMGTWIGDRDHELLDAFITCLDDLKSDAAFADALAGSKSAARAAQLRSGLRRRIDAITDPAIRALADAHLMAALERNRQIQFFGYVRALGQPAEQSRLLQIASPGVATDNQPIFLTHLRLEHLVPDPIENARVLNTFAMTAAPDQHHEILNIIGNFSEDAKAVALAGAGGRISPELQPRALAMIKAFGSANNVVRALGGVRDGQDRHRPAAAAWMPEHQSQILDLIEIRLKHDTENLTEALRQVGPGLSPDLYPHILKIINGTHLSLPQIQKIIERIGPDLPQKYWPDVRKIIEELDSGSSAAAWASCL